MVYLSCKTLKGREKSYKANIKKQESLFLLSLYTVHIYSFNMDLVYIFFALCLVPSIVSQGMYDILAE